MSGRKASVLLCIILCGVAVTDLRCRKVSNRWLLLGYLGCIILRGPGFFRPALIMFFPVYLLFRLRLMGAGDGKVIMLIAGSLGAARGAWAVFFGFVAAALFSLMKIIHEGSLPARLLRLRAMAGDIVFTGRVPQCDRDALCSRENTIPLAACLAAGTMIYIFVSEIFICGGSYV